MARKKPRFEARSGSGGNFSVTDTKTGNICPKLYQNTPAGDCVYPADDFTTLGQAQRFADKMNTEVKTKRYRSAIAEFPDHDHQILLAAQADG